MRLQFLTIFLLGILASTTGQEILHLAFEKNTIEQESFRWGIKQFTDDKNTSENNLISTVYFVNCWLKDKENECSYIKYNDTDYVTMKGQKSDPRAVMNVLFFKLGNVLGKNCRAKPCSNNNDQLIPNLFVSLMATISKDEISKSVLGLELGIVAFKNDKGDVIENKTWNFIQENNITAHSRFLYIILNKEDKQNLPAFLKQSGIRFFPLHKCISQHSSEEMFAIQNKTPVEKVSQQSKTDTLPIDAMKTDIDSENISKEKSSTIKDDEAAIVNREEKEDNSYTQIFLKGNVPEGLQIVYEVYNLDRSESEVYIRNYSDNGLPVYVKNPEQRMPNQHFKVIITKPRNYNIYNLASSDPEKDWKKKEFELNVDNRSPIKLGIKKFTTYDFFYVDVSKIKKRNEIVDYLKQKINSIVKNDNQYFLFLSNSNRPFFADDPDDFERVLKVLSTIDPDPPIPQTDTEVINKNIDKNRILNSYKNVNFHFFLSKPTYKLSRVELIVKLLKGLKDKKWNVSIYTDYDAGSKDPIGYNIADFNYNYININKWRDQ